MSAEGIGADRGSTPPGRVSAPAPIAGTIRGAEGVKLRTWSWPHPSPRGRVQLVHGFSEHLGRYREVVDALHDAGWAVFGHDHRGHGESEGRRGVLRSFDHLLHDLDLVRRRADALAPGPGAPVLLGHSLGGLVTLRYLQTAPAPPSRAILSAPWLGTQLVLPLWQQVVARSLRRIAPDFVVKRRLDTSLLTRDAERGALYANDPLVHRYGSPGVLARVGAAQEEAIAGGLPPGMRLLVILPLDDRVADPERTVGWASRLPAGSVQIERYPRGRHEPFHDIERSAVLDTVIAWLNEEGPSGSSAEISDEG
ncbi:MAG: alpha/beta hydrolase [Longimicrobiales bacterium]|nr:alpha/beta hydrolase [Longimicrobiales bacterium]